MSGFQVGDVLTRTATMLTTPRTETITITRIYPDQIWGTTPEGQPLGFSTRPGHEWTHQEATA